MICFEEEFQVGGAKRSPVQVSLIVMLCLEAQQKGVVVNELNLPVGVCVSPGENPPLDRLRCLGAENALVCHNLGCQTGESPHLSPRC